MKPCPIPDGPNKGIHYAGHFSKAVTEVPRKNRIIPIQSCRSMWYHRTCVYKLRNGRSGAAYRHTCEDGGILQCFDRLSGWPDRRPHALSQKARIDKLCTERKGILPSQNADADRDRPERLIQNRDRETECRIALALDTSMNYLAGLTDVPTCRDCLQKRERKFHFPLAYTIGAML